MFFGKFQSDRKLDAQRLALNEAVDLLDSLERRVANTVALRAAYGEAWDAAGGIPEDIAPGLAACRKLADLLVQQMAAARRELVKFDSAVAALKARSAFLDRRWQVFVALLTARKLILDGSAPGIAPTLDPSVETCQRAMIGVARRLHRDLDVHIDQLFDIRARFRGNWPALLNLEKIRIGMIDISNALEICSGRLANGQGELSEDSTLTLMDMVSTLETTISMVEEQRAQIAVHNVMSEAMRNTGLR